MKAERGTLMHLMLKLNENRCKKIINIIVGFARNYRIKDYTTKISKLLLHMSTSMVHNLSQFFFKSKLKHWLKKQQTVEALPGSQLCS